MTAQIIPSDHLENRPKVFKFALIADLSAIKRKRFPNNIKQRHAWAFSPRDDAVFINIIDHLKLPQSSQYQRA